MVIRRGDIWWADLPDPVGSGPGLVHPVLIIQSDRYNQVNQSALRRFVVVLITSNLDRAEEPGNTLLEPEESGLKRMSVVNGTQITTVPESVLDKKIGRLSIDRMEEVMSGIKLVLGI
jgi:mRNA interferase MazF